MAARGASPATVTAAMATAGWAGVAANQRRGYKEVEAMSQWGAGTLPEREGCTEKRRAGSHTRGLLDHKTQTGPVPPRPCPRVGPRPYPLAGPRPPPVPAPPSAPPLPSPLAPPWTGSNMAVSPGNHRDGQGEQPISAAKRVAVKRETNGVRQWCRKGRGLGRRGLRAKPWGPQTVGDTKNPWGHQTLGDTKF